MDIIMFSEMGCYVIELCCYATDECAKGNEKSTDQIHVVNRKLFLTAYWLYVSDFTIVEIFVCRSQLVHLMAVAFLTELFNDLMKIV